MKTYQTDLHRTISAESRTRADELALQYGLGKIVKEISRTKAKQIDKSVLYIAWNELTQATELEGKLETVAKFFAENVQDNSTIGLLVRSWNGGIRKPNKLELEEFYNYLQVNTE